MSFDNRTFDMTGEGPDDLRDALAFAFRQVATHYLIDAGGLVLCWHEEKDSIALPYPLNRENAFDFVSNWLAHASLSAEPDIDGDAIKGFRVSTGPGWNHVQGSNGDPLHYAFVRVEPFWALYGK